MSFFSRPTNDPTNDAFWNELKELISAFVEGRVSGFRGDDTIDFRTFPSRDVSFEYHLPSAYVKDKKTEEFVDNIIKSLRY